MAFEFEWDPAKADQNLKDHDGVSFREATTVFRDTLSITIADPDHSDSEIRFIDVGMSHRGRLHRGIVHGTRRQNSNHKRAARDSGRTEKL